MIHIKVPATTANLGPGFDTLGLALNLYHEIAVSHSKSANSSVRWAHEEQAMTDDENLVIQGMMSVFKRYGAMPVPYTLEMLNCDIPASRGLGSSAAAYVSGVVAGLYLLDLPIDKKTILKIASDLEGHPDNVAPAVFGGLIASCMAEHDVLYQNVHMGKPIQFIALIPDCKLSTHEARAVLPKLYTKEEVVFSLSHLSILISALQNGSYDLLRNATQDMLHQPHRLSLMPDADQLVALSQLPVCYGGFVSGAGSTYMLMCSPENLSSVLEQAEQLLSAGSAHWNIKPLDLEAQGTFWEVH